MSLTDQLKSINQHFSSSKTRNNSFKVPAASLPAFIISDLNNHVSLVAVRKLLKSIELTDSYLQPSIIPATTPKTLLRDMSRLKISFSDWTYPTVPNQTIIDSKSGMKLTGYRTNDINKVIACAISHLRIWHIVAAGSVPAIILEHDALFTKQFFYKDFKAQAAEFSIVGLNDPRGATRKASVYLQKTIDNYNLTSEQRDADRTAILDVPWVDDNQKAPQGIAGNSAYLITPAGARSLIERVTITGLWPNDALMCKQFFPGLKQAYPFFTTVQGVPSTTTG